MKKNYFQSLFKSPKLILISAFLLFSTISFSQTHVYDTVCQNEVYVLPAYGPVVNLSPGTHIFNDTLLNTSGNDSIIITHLTVNAVYNTSVNLTFCQSDTLLSSGVYIDTLSTIAGCDSIIIYTITVIPTVVFTQSVIYCDSIGNSGVYMDTLVASSGCDSIVYNLVTFVPPFTVTITQNGQTLTVSTSASSPSMFWSGPCIISGATTATITIGCPGTYTVTIVDQNGCTKTGTFTVTTIGINEVNGSSIQAQVYPNPNNGVFSFVNVEKGSSIEIYDVTGRIIYQNSIISTTQQIDISEKSKGIYFYRIISLTNFIQQGKISVK